MSYSKLYIFVFPKKLHCSAYKFWCFINQDVNSVKELKVGASVLCKYASNFLSFQNFGCPMGPTFKSVAGHPDAILANRDHGDLLTPFN